MINTPKIRFAGFTDAWKQRKLKDLANVKDSARISNDFWTDNGVPYIRASDLSNNDLSGVLFLSEETYSFYKKQTGAPSCGDLLFNGGGEIGKAVLKRDDKPLYVQGGAVLYVQTSSATELDGEYLESYFLSPAAKKYIDIASAGGTMKHFTLGPSQEMPIIYPSLVEQKKIGKFTTSLDSLITLHQRKCDALQKFKKSMLQKMFPRDGENVPEIRFAGFTDAWEQRKLGEVIEELYNGQTPSRANNEYWNGNINWLASGDLNRGIVTHTTEKITNKGLEDTHLRIVPKGTFVMAITGLEAAGTRGNCGILGIDTALNQSCMALFPIDKILDTKFMFQWYRKVGEEYGINYTQGTKQQSYNAELIKILPISFPNIEEQKKIADFFSKLDRLITLHQRKLETLQNMKKSLLQKMFPPAGRAGV